MKKIPDEGDSPDSRSPSHARAAWLGWLQQVTTLIYLVAGGFLFYFWSRSHRQSLLLIAILFIAYGIYRFFLVRRWIRRH